MLGAQPAGPADLQHPESTAGHALAWKPRIAAGVSVGFQWAGSATSAGSCLSLGPTLYGLLFPAPRLPTFPFRTEMLNYVSPGSAQLSPLEILSWHSRLLQNTIHQILVLLHLGQKLTRPFCLQSAEVPVSISPALWVQCDSLQVGLQDCLVNE